MGRIAYYVVMVVLLVGVGAVLVTVHLGNRSP
jgi:hypothetical protein